MCMIAVILAESDKDGVIAKSRSERNDSQPVNTTSVSRYFRLKGEED